MDLITPSLDTLFSPTPDRLHFPACLAAVAIVAWLAAGYVRFYRSAVDKSLSMRYQNLDGFRGILATSVVFHHFACNQGLLATGVWGATSDFLRNLGTIPVALLILAVAPYPAELYSIEGALPLRPVFRCVACGNTFHGVLKTRPLALLGTASLGIYMLHMAIVS